MTTYTFTAVVEPDEDSWYAYCPALVQLGRRVTVSYHSPGQTFAPKILHPMLELQARWIEDDLRRLRLLGKP
jgi:lipoate-protein ligase B